MRKTIGAALFALGALALPLSAPGEAQAQAKERQTWALAFLDAEGNPTDLRTAYDFVAFVRGPRGFVLELACTADDRMLFRIARRVAGKERFTGATFLPTFEVRDGGRTVTDITLKNDFAYREGPMHYQGPVWDRLMTQLAKGDAVRVSEGGTNFKVTFSLKGSAVAIAALPCSGSS